MIAGIIPARYASSRFPGKPLADVMGKSMIQRVYEQALKTLVLSEVYVATDDHRIYDHVIQFGGKALMTSANHASGTDRCYEALLLLEKRYRYVINIQGDEPFIDPVQIEQLASLLQDGNVELATLMIPVKSYSCLFDKGEVKITLNKNMEALYFSRSVIPYIKGEDQSVWHTKYQYYRHVGMYAYRSDILEKISNLKPSDLEKAESLEQLRWIENGFKIKCGITTIESHCIDEPADIEKVTRIMHKS